MEVVVGPESGKLVHASCAETGADSINVPVVTNALADSAMAAARLRIFISDLPSEPLIVRVHGHE